MWPSVGFLTGSKIEAREKKKKKKAKKQKKSGCIGGKKKSTYKQFIGEVSFSEMKYKY